MGENRQAFSQRHHAAACVNRMKNTHSVYVVMLMVSSTEISEEKTCSRCCPCIALKIRRTDEAQFTPNANQDFHQKSRGCDNCYRALYER